MDLGTVWDVLSTTMVFGVSLASVLGKLFLLVAVVLVARVAEKAVARLAHRMLDAASVPSSSIIVNMLRGLVWSLALMTVLEPVFGIQPTAFLAALGIGSLALTLGLQDTVSNIIGGLSLMVSKVIVPGDYIRVGDFTGLVTDINWRSTCVRDAYGQTDVIPNSVLSKTALVKLSEYTRGRCQIAMVVRHGTDINDVVADVARAARDVLGKRVDPKMDIEVLFEGFDAGGIQAKANVHLARGADIDGSRSLLVERLARCPWAVNSL
ncbi:MAG: mechanosensitive ion channel [Atopobiaceae bacterium]|nr:mechanosensitive ion channel [Atopobiaceae bacterium]